MRLSRNTAALLLLPFQQLRTGPAPVLRRWLAAAAMVALFAMLVIGTKPLQIKVAGVEAVEGDPARQIFYAAMFLVLLIGAQPHRQPARLLVLPISMTLLMLWCTASVAWALFPGIALRRFILTGVIIWSIFRMVDELGYDRSIDTLRWVWTAALVLNFLAVLISPVAVHAVGERVDPALIGNWRGFFTHKNFAGEMCAVTIFAFLFGGRHWRALPRIIVLAAATFFLIKTSSKTSINMLVVGIACGVIFLRYNPAYRLLLIPLVMVVGSIISYELIVHWNVIIAPLYGPDTTVLTGRVVIWPIVLRFVASHMWLGAGFGSFWGVGPDGPVFRLTKEWPSQLGNGHNGYLDLLAQLGIPGLTLAILALVVIPLARLLMSRTIARGPGAFLVAVIVFFAGHNMTETTMMDRDSLGQIFMVLAVALTAASVRSPMLQRAGRARITGGRTRRIKHLDEGVA